MRSEVLVAINQLAAEKNLPREVVLRNAERALATALRKEALLSSLPITVKISTTTGEVQVFVQKTAVPKVTEPRQEVSLEEARQFAPEIQEGEMVEVPTTIPGNSVRIVAQLARQVLMQSLREAEQSALFEEFHAREGDVVTAAVQRVEPKGVYLDLGRGEALLPASEQVKGERYRAGQRLKVYLLEVQRGSRGTQVVVSRSHKNLLRRLIELEVPEIRQGIVEIKAIAREPGSRSKLAVVAHQDSVDPVGSCVGQRGIRIQGIVRELGGEKIDVVVWDPNPATFIANALSPAQVVGVSVREEGKTAEVVVPDRQLSLSIGKEGQNARLAAKLTGWRIDIKAASVVAAERQARAKEAAAAAPVEVGVAEPTAVAAAGAAPEPALVAAALQVSAPAVAEPVLPPEAPAPPEEVPEEAAVSLEEIFAPVKTAPAEGAGLRFAEDIPELHRGVQGKKRRGEEEKGKKAKRRVTLPQGDEEPAP